MMTVFDPFSCCKKMMNIDEIYIHVEVVVAGVLIDKIYLYNENLCKDR